MPKLTSLDNRRPKKSWWLVGIVLFMLFLLLQMPAAWVMKKFAPEANYIQHISGNIWQGSAVWQLPVGAVPLSGTASWSWRPWQVFLGKFGADVAISSGQSSLKAKVAIGKSSWQASEVNGKITPETLNHVMDWQLPNSPIKVQDVMLKREAKKGENPSGFSKASGQLIWAGGEVGYPSGGRVFRLLMPSTFADLSAEQKNNKRLLHITLNNQQNKRLGDLYLDGDNMLDVNLTQRLLETMPEYKGQAPLDTPVVSVRQPLISSLGSSLGSAQ